MIYKILFVYLTNLVNHVEKGFSSSCVIVFVKTCT